MEVESHLFVKNIVIQGVDAIHFHDFFQGVYQVTPHQALKT